MKRIFYLLIVTLMITLVSCENYSNGERIGVLTRVSEKGIIFKSTECNLNVTQTGMNSSGEPFLFSMDNDKPNPILLDKLKKSAEYGYKIKVIYHEVRFLNWFSNRGETDYFVNDIEILDTTFSRNPFIQYTKPEDTTVDTTVDTKDTGTIKVTAEY